MPRVALGKGLGALINTRVVSPTPAPELGERIQHISLGEIIPTPMQPRRRQKEEAKYSGFDELTLEAKQNEMVNDTFASGHKGFIVGTRSSIDSYQAAVQRDCSSLISSQRYPTLFIHEPQTYPAGIIDECL